MRLTIIHKILLMLIAFSFLIGTPCSFDPDDVLESDIKVTRGVLIVGPGHVYETISDAVNDAVDGDTIRVYDGVYNGSVKIEVMIDIIGNGSGRSIVNHSSSGTIFQIERSNCLIEGFEITSSAPDSLGIRSVSEDTIIRNCLIHNLTNGIDVSGTTNQTIMNGTIEYCQENGIVAGSTSYCTIMDTVCSNMNEDGLKLVDASHNSIIDCSFDYCDEGINIQGDIDNISISGSSCTFNRNGIYATGNLSSPGNCGDNLFYDLDLSDNTGYGLYIKDMVNTRVENSQVVNNAIGIHIYSSDNFNVSMIIADNNTDIGILSELSTNHTFYRCQAKLNYVGMKIEKDQQLKVHECLFKNDTYALILKGSHPQASECGIYGNNFTQNKHTINISRSIGSRIIDNTFYKNENFGLVLGLDCQKNLVYHNRFLQNNNGNPQALDHNSVGENYWNTSGRGNHWSDWTTPDNDKNGVVDEPYQIGGFLGMVDHYPLVYPNCTTKFSYRLPILIEGDDQFLPSNGVRSGSGTLLDPYIISGWEIDARNVNAGIKITNSTSHFVIKNCNIRSNLTNRRIEYVRNNVGIGIINTTNGIVQGNKIGNVLTGIVITHCENFKLINNDIDMIKYYGIWSEDSISCTFIGNTFSYCGFYFSGDGKNFFNTHTITDDNLINGRPFYYYKNSNLSSVKVPVDAGGVLAVNVYGLEMMDLKITNTSVGIMAAYCSSLKIRNCLVSDTNWDCIVINNTENSIIESNTVHKGMYNGIMIRDCHGLVVSNNDVRCHEDDGIDLDYSTNNSISHNLCTGNLGNGISLYYADHNSIDNNTSIQNNANGILLGTSSFTDIRENDLLSNGINGIFISEGKFNIIFNNNISNNGDEGVDTFGSNNTITYNWIQENQDCGVYLFSKGVGNLVYCNNFIENKPNGSQVGDNTWSNNTWYGPYGEGNFWSDYQDHYPWATNDGHVWKTPYEIFPYIGVKDWYPLVNYAILNLAEPELFAELNKTAIVNYTYTVNFTVMDIDTKLDLITWELNTNASFLKLVNINSSSYALVGLAQEFHIGTYFVNVSVFDGKYTSFIGYELEVVGLEKEDPDIPEPIKNETPDIKDNEPDNDNDGLNDTVDPDDDNDGIPDEWEEEHGLDPFVNDSMEDNDQDDKTNMEEYLNQTDPNKKEEPEKPPDEPDPDEQPDHRFIIIAAVVLSILIAVIIALLVIIWKIKKQPKELMGLEHHDDERISPGYQDQDDREDNEYPMEDEDLFNDQDDDPYNRSDDDYYSGSNYDEYYNDSNYDDYYNDSNYDDYYNDSNYDEDEFQDLDYEDDGIYEGSPGAFDSDEWMDDDNDHYKFGGAEKDPDPYPKGEQPLKQMDYDDDFEF